MRSIRLTDGTAFKVEWIEEVLELSDTDRANHFRHVTRASGTEPLVRIWGVGREEQYVQNRVGNIVNAIQRSLKMPVTA